MRCALAAVTLVAAVAADCTYFANNDYDQGSGGPNFPATNSSSCCSMCIAAGSAACYAAVFDPMTGGICWYKTQAQTKSPVWSPGVTACWPPGSVPPPSPSPPPPPPPALYTVNVTALPPNPVVSYLPYPGATPSFWQQSFNPSFVEATPGTRGVRGLIIRSQNCSFTPGECARCNGLHPFVGSVMSFAAQAANGSFAQPYLIYAPQPGLLPEEEGTEDPRVAYDASTGLYHMFYTCYGPGGGLCHSTTLDPTAPYPGNWTRHGVMWPGKSAALLIRPSPPHYLYQGDSSIALWSTDDLFNYTLLNKSFITTRPDSFDSDLVEAGPPPLRLSDGNYIFFHNSADSTSSHAYHPEYVILNGSDPTQILQRAQTPLLTPTRIWETGTAPAECNVQDVVFLEAAAPVMDGTPDTFDVWFGGSDAVVGTARITVTRL